MLARLSRYASGQRGSSRGRLLVNASWTLVATLSTYATTALGGILAARLLGTVGFGELGIVRSTVVTFGVLSGTGLGVGATKYIAELRSLDPVRAGRVLGLLIIVALIMGGVTAGALVLLAEPLAVSFLGEPGLATPLRVAALLLLISALSGVLVGALGGFESFRTIARITAAEGLITLVAIVSGAWLAGVTGAVLGQAAGMLATMPLKIIAVRRQCRAASVSISMHGALTEARVLRSFVAPAFIVAVSVQPFEWIARLLLARGPDGLAQVGLFTAAFAWGQFVLFLPGQVISPGMPILADLFARDQGAELRRLSRDLLVLTAALGGGTALLLGLLATPLMNAYGSDFTRARNVMLLLLCAHWLAAFTVFFRNFFTATEQMWLQAMHAALWGIALIIAFALIGHTAVALGAAYVVGYAVTLTIQIVTAVVFIRRRVGGGSGGVLATGGAAESPATQVIQ